MKGSTYRRCKCRGADGRELGTGCPQLHRSDGAYADHGSWYARLELEPDVDGKRRTIRRGGFATKKAASAWLDEAKGKAARGADVARKITVGAYLSEWLAGKRNLRETTRRSYRQHLDDFLVPHLGRVELGALRRSHVEAMFDELEMGAATKQRIRATLRSALHDAEREGLVVVNAARLTRLESGARPQVHPLEPAELGRLLDHLAADVWGPLFETIAATGLRRGEALGLRWSDVDIDHGTLTVRRQLVQLAGRHDCPNCGGHNGVMLAEPKTASGARVVELDAHTVGVLLDQRLRQDEDRGRWRDAYADHDFVFAREDGNPLPPDRVTKRFAELCDEAGVRKVRLHDLRHGSASLMLAAGVDLALVSKILGHSQIAITADSYSHLLEGVGRSAAEAASALVPRAPRGWSETLGLPSGS